MVYSLCHYKLHYETSLYLSFDNVQIASFNEVSNVVDVANFCDDRDEFSRAKKFLLYNSSALKKRKRVAMILSSLSLIL